jgi:hypothetical protein
MVYNKVQSILDSVHIIPFFLRWNCYSRNKLGNWGLDTHATIASFDTNDFMSCMLISFNKDVIIIMSINNDGMKSCLWDNNQNILHKLLISVRWFLSFLFKKIGQLKDRVGQVLFLVSCPKGQVKKNVNVEACRSMVFFSLMTIWMNESFLDFLYVNFTFRCLHLCF